MDREIAIVLDQTIRIFLKEERWFAVRIMTHFDSVVGIIAPDTVNPVNRKQFFRPGHTEDGLSNWLEKVFDVLHHGPFTRD